MGYKNVYLPPVYYLNGQDVTFEMTGADREQERIGELEDTLRRLRVELEWWQVRNGVTPTPPPIRHKFSVTATPAQKEIVYSIDETNMSDYHIY